MVLFKNMKSTAAEITAVFQKLRATIHRDTKLICSETCHFLGLEITKPAMEIIAELVFKKLSVFGTDLEAFARHAKRQTINADDVKLLVRRNPSLVTYISDAAGNTSKEKRRKTAVPSKTPAPNPPDTAKSKSNDATALNIQESVAPESPKMVKKTTEQDNFESFINDENMIDLTFD